MHLYSEQRVSYNTNVHAAEAPVPRRSVLSSSISARTPLQSPLILDASTVPLGHGTLFSPVQRMMANIYFCAGTVEEHYTT